MPITELNLYKTEWLELVFDDRNKSYGAYDLRKHYAQNLFKALLITVSGFVALLLTANYFMTHQTKTDGGIIIDLKPYAPPVPPTKKPIDPPKPKVTPPQVQTIKYLPMRPTIDEEAENPPNIDDLKSSIITTETHKGVIDSNANLDIPDNGNGSTLKSVTEDEPKPFGTIEVNPEFPGGEAAWSKFLQKNLKYPSQAIDAGAGGKVFVSFVVERDGHLSDIKIIRGVGYGLDEEAVRVLKLVPPWKPGIQNGRPVRVMYTMPFNFQLPTDN